HACDSYNAEKQQLDGEAIQLNQRQIQKRYKELDEEKSGLEAEAGSLASRRRVLYESKENLQQDVTSFSSKCEEAGTRTEALALKRLKEKGSLQPGDPSYEAIRHMLQETRNDTPTGQVEFTWQSVTSSTTLLEGLAAAAGQYASQKIEHVGRDLMHHLSAIQKQTIGQAGYQVFKKAISIDVEAGANQVTETLLKGSAEG